MPTWILVLLVAMAVAGMLLGGWAAWPRPHIGTFAAHDPDLPRRAYVFCQGCHGIDGRGIPGNYPPLAGSPIVLGDPAAAALLVLHGSASGRFNGRMPAFARQLADNEIAAALTHARTSWGNQAGPVDAAQVAALRNRP